MRLPLLPKEIILQLRLTALLKHHILTLGVHEQITEFRADGTIATVDFSGARGSEGGVEGYGVADCVAVAVGGVGCLLGGGHF